MDTSNNVQIDWTKADLTARRYPGTSPDWFRLTYSEGDNHIMLIGEDTDGDGVVDFIHADTTGSGRIDFSAFFKDGRWQKTNLVEAWLEVNFSLPMARDNYVPHNAELRFNGVTIAAFRDSLPEGHYAFPIPPRAIQFPMDRSRDDVIEVVSQHLRGGHYLVTSDFQVVYRLTEVDAFVIAESRESAEHKIVSTPGFRFSGGDPAVSSNDISLSKTDKIAPGERINVSVTVSNMGMDPVNDVTVAMIQTLPGGSNPREISRITLPEVGLYGPTVVTFPWIAVPGQHTLNIIVDPENLLGENSRFNNKAMITVSVPGKDTPPQVQIVSPQPGVKTDSPAVILEVMGIDETGILLMEYRLDDGIWVQRQGIDHLRETLTVPPGEHVIHVRATDCGGNAVEDSRTVTAEYSMPAISILEPLDNGITAKKTITLVVEVENPPAVQSIQASINHGAWLEIPFSGQKRLSADLPLEFGKQIIEVKAKYQNGLESIIARSVESTDPS